MPTWCNWLQTTAPPVHYLQPFKNGQSLKAIVHCCLLCRIVWLPASIVLAVTLIKNANQFFQPLTSELLKCCQYTGNKKSARSDQGLDLKVITTHTLKRRLCENNALYSRFIEPAAVGMAC